MVEKPDKLQLISGISQENKVCDQQEHKSTEHLKLVEQNSFVPSFHHFLGR